MHGLILSEERDDIMQQYNSKKRKSGFTLVELTISLAIISVIVLAINNVIADQYAGWENAFGRIFGETSESVVKVRKAFNGTCRKASLRNINISEDGETLVLYYYNDPIDPPYWPDRYAKYYLENGDMLMEHGSLVFGTIDEEQAIYTETLASNVTYLSFSVQSLSVQLCMTIDDGKNDFTFAWTSVRHN